MDRSKINCMTIKYEDRNRELERQKMDLQDVSGLCACNPPAPAKPGFLANIITKIKSLFFGRNVDPCVCKPCDVEMPELPDDCTCQPCMYPPPSPPSQPPQPPYEPSCVCTPCPIMTDHSDDPCACDPCDHTEAAPTANVCGCNPCPSDAPQPPQIEPSKPTCNEPPDNNSCVCSISVGGESIDSCDLQKLKRLVTLVENEKQLKKRIEELKVQESVCSCMDDPRAKELRELRRKVKLLQNEVDDANLARRQQAELVEGPVKHELERERYKIKRLQEEMDEVVKTKLESDEYHWKEMNALKMQLCVATSNVNELNSLNTNLKEELAKVEVKLKEMQDELINQKLREADMIRRLRAECQAQQQAPPPKKKCEMNLYEIARKLSKALAESAECGECMAIPSDFACAVECIKKLADMVHNETGGGQGDQAIVSTPSDVQEQEEETVEEQDKPQSVPETDALSEAIPEEDADESVEAQIKCTCANMLKILDEKKNKCNSSRKSNELTDLAKKLCKCGKKETKKSGCQCEPKKVEQKCGCSSKTDKQPIAEEKGCAPCPPTSPNLDAQIEELFKPPPCSCTPNAPAARLLGGCQPPPAMPTTNCSPPTTGGCPDVSSPPKDEKKCGCFDRPPPPPPPAPPREPPSGCGPPDAPPIEGDTRKCKCSPLPPCEGETVDTDGTGYKIVQQATVGGSDENVNVVTSTNLIPESTFPYDVDTKVDVIDVPTAGMHVTTSITRSGTIDVVTEGPEGVIGTTLTYTNSGNIQVNTEITDKPPE